VLGSLGKDFKNIKVNFEIIENKESIHLDEAVIADNKSQKSGSQ
jgi:hypothetical protein